MLTHKAFYETGPIYLSELIKKHNSSNRTRRANDHCLLSIPLFVKCVPIVIRMIEGGFIFSHRYLVPPNSPPPQKKVDFVGNIKRSSTKNVFLCISTKTQFSLTSHYMIYI